MSENNNALLWTLIVIGALCLIATVVVIGKINAPEAVDYAKISSMITAAIANIPAPVAPTAAAVTVPTAAEIAALVVIPSNEISDNDKVNDLWYETDSIRIKLYTLKAEAVKFILDEMGFNVSAFNVSAVVNSSSLDVQIKNVDLDNEDAIEDILDDLNIEYDEIYFDFDDYPIIVEDDTEVTIQDLGLDDSDDQKATVKLVLKVKHDTMENDYNGKKYIAITGKYFIDKHGHADSEITYALKAQ